MRTSEQMIELDIAGPRRGTAVRFVETAVAFIASAWRVAKNRHAINRLDDMDDHQLNDIGLTRPELKAVLRTTALNEDPSMRLARSARGRAQRALRG